MKALRNAKSNTKKRQAAWDHLQELWEGIMDTPDVLGAWGTPGERSALLSRIEEAMETVTVIEVRIEARKADRA